MAAHELSQENDLDVDRYLYGGCFCTPANGMGEMPHNLVPELGMRRYNFEIPRDGEVMIAKNPETKQHKEEKTVKPKIGSSSRCEHCLTDVGGNETPALQAD